MEMLVVVIVVIPAEKRAQDVADDEDEDGGDDDDAGEDDEKIEFVLKKMDEEIVCYVSKVHLVDVRKENKVKQPSLLLQKPFYKQRS